MKNTILAAVLAVILVGVGFAGAVVLFRASGTGSEINLSSNVMRMIHVDDSVRDEGVRVDRVLLADTAPQATVYVRFQRPFSANVLLLAYDRTGVEIGRSKRALAGKTDEAAYFTFDYDARIPLKSAEGFRLVYASVQTNAPEVAPDATPAETPNAEPMSAPQETVPETPEKTEVLVDVVAEPVKEEATAVQ